MYLGSYVVAFLCLLSNSLSQLENISDSLSEPRNIPLAGSRPVYELVDWNVVIPQWLKTDAFDVDDITKPFVRKLLRFPPLERRYIFTHNNQELIVLSTEELQLVPNASVVLRTLKAPRRLFARKDYQPLLSTGVIARHRFAEGIHIRWKTIGFVDEPLIAGLYMPTGWPLTLLVTFGICVFLVPLIGSFLVHAGFKVAAVYKFAIWGPIKAFLRWFLIREQLNNQSWQKYIAPPYFLEPRTSWKLPYFLRNDQLEDIPCELAYKPAINRIDYTWYVLTEEDYDEMDLGYDEMEYVDDLLQFRDENPQVVARLLKHRLGVEKFYYYFDEDILSDESDDEEDADLFKKSSTEPGQEGEDGHGQFGYMKLLEMDEPWMHDEFDKTFNGPLFQLEEIRKRRQIINQLKSEIQYLHKLVMHENIYDQNLEPLTDEERKKVLKKAQQAMDKFTRFSEVTKERIAEIEPSEKIQIARNTVLSKYLPLIDQMSHYNHRLNLKHEKQRDPARRRLQLDIFAQKIYCFSQKTLSRAFTGNYFLSLWLYISFIVILPTECISNGYYISGGYRYLCQYITKIASTWLCLAEDFA